MPTVFHEVEMQRYNQLEPPGQYRDAAEEIFTRYEIWLGDERHGNQDREACISTIAAIIRKHYQLPASIQEALNSGDGTYRP